MSSMTRTMVTLSATAVLLTAALAAQPPDHATLAAIRDEGLARLAGDGPHQLVERRLWTARHRHPGDRTGQGLDDGEAPRVGPLGRARGALQVRARLVAGAVSRAHGRAASDADHRVSEVLVVEHRWHGDGRGDAGRHRDGGRLRDIPRHPARQDCLAAAGTRGPDARGRSGAADDRRATRRGQPDPGASTGPRAPAETGGAQMVFPSTTGSSSSIWRRVWSRCWTVAAMAS